MKIYQKRSKRSGFETTPQKCKRFVTMVENENNIHVQDEDENDQEKENR